MPHNMLYKRTFLSFSSRGYRKQAKKNEARASGTSAFPSWSLGTRRTAIHYALRYLISIHDWIVHLFFASLRLCAKIGFITRSHAPAWEYNSRALCVKALVIKSRHLRCVPRHIAAVPLRSVGISLNINARRICLLIIAFVSFLKTSR